MVGAVNAFMNSYHHRLMELKEACVNFEQIMMFQLLEEMYKTLPGDPMMPNTAENEIYRFMYTNALAHDVAENSHLGIADMLYNSLKGAVRGTDSGTKASVALESKENLMGRIMKAVDEASREYGVSKRLILAVIKAESDFNPDAVSDKGAVGLMQLMPSTAMKLGVRDLTDVYENIMGGVKYLSYLLSRFGDEKKAIAAYNAGPVNVERYGGVPPYRETKEYVERVLAYAKDF